MTMRYLKIMAAGVAFPLLLGGTVGTVSPAHAGGLGKAIIGRVLMRDRVRDAATVARPLAKPRSVHRYTTGAQAARESRRGLAPDTHMTSNARRGRPLGAEAAQRRYGLPQRPDVRETVHLPAGHPVRHNRTLGGEPGWGEITSPKMLPKESVTRVVPLR